MAPAPFTLNWGIISTGGIATRFSQDLLVDPSTRNASDVLHKITAVGSRSVPSAQAFVDKLKALDAPYSWGVQKGYMDDTKAYGSYDEVFADPNVNAVYIGTPHNLHHAPAKAALLAGKHVLCEKPFTLDLAELDELLAIAKEKDLFLMEAVWTRFHPIAYEVQKVIHSGKLGKVKRFQADFSMDIKPDTLDKGHRMVNPDLAGGSLLDQGPYPAVWAMLVLYLHPDNQRTPPEFVSSTQRIFHGTGVDQSSRWLLRFPGLGGVEASLLTDMATKGFKDSCCLVQCEKGDLSVEYPPYIPKTFNIIPHADAKAEDGSMTEASRHHHPGDAGGSMHYEADEVARCIRDGKKESERMTWEESRMTQGWLDKVRKDGDSVLKDMKGTAGQ